jgi:hypothetical protein
MKLDANGSKIVYSTYLGGLGSDVGQAIAVDNAGRAYIFGQTDSFDFPIAKALQPRAAGQKDAFLSVLDPAGAHLMWSTYLGGSSDDWLCRQAERRRVCYYLLNLRRWRCSRYRERCSGGYGRKHLRRRRDFLPRFSHGQCNTNVTGRKCEWICGSLE